MPTIDLEIVTPEKVAYNEPISVLEAPAIDGLIGILPRHAPLVTALKIGVLEVQKDDEKFLISISDGFMEVKPDKIKVVVRSAELPKEINVERAKKAKSRAEKRLQSESDKINAARAQTALERALARLKVAEFHNIR